MASIAIIGDGPGGLSAALFLAKNDQQVTVFGTDDTAMHSAFLHNYLGVPSIAGSEFQQVARTQVEGYGGTIVDVRVIAVVAGPGGHTLTLEKGGPARADYLILSEGRSPVIGPDLGVDMVDGAIAVDRNQRTSLPRVYAVGRSTRPARSQAIISAGDGAVAALDILSTEAGADVKDWDTE
jgi:thioredoxin reductase (NADPH)